MFKIIMLRLIREFRLLAVLLLSMCLVTAFLALGPLYIQALSISDFDQRIEQAVDVTFSVTVRNALPFTETVPNLIDNYLGEYIGVQRSYATLSGFECGFLYDEDAPNNIGASSFTYSCYRPYVYDNFADYFTLAEGRFPQDTGSTTVEALLSLEAANEGGYGIGDRFIMGSDPNQVVIFEVVGLVETILPTDSPFWFQQTMPHLTQTYFTATDVRSDLSFAITENAFQTQVLEIASNETYVRQFEILPETLEALDVDNFEAQLAGLEDELTLLHPDVSFTTPYKQLLADYQRGIEGAQGSISILSFIVFALMIYNIVAISSLILEQQSQEWSMMASRGGSYFQLVYIQFLTVLVLGIIAAVVGAFVAYIIMIILAIIGPYAAIIDVNQLGTIPLASYALSAIAATIIVIVLTIPAWSLASKSLQSLKSSMARAPKSPIWARYYLDVIILGAGILFIVRLFALATDQPLADVLLNPSAWVDLLSDAAFTELFSDAFNLAAPVLILLGASMLWLRIFPFFVELLGSLVSNSKGLTLRLAFWNVARDPAHYAQLVLLLIATLALGTASVTLTQTHQVGGWSAARAEVGADASLSLDPRFYNEAIDWDAFPDVINATPLMIYSTDLNNTEAVIGMNLDDINSDASNSELTEPFSSLTDTSIDLPGMLLPEDTLSLELDVYPEAPQEDGVIQTQLSFTIEDIAGRSTTLDLTSAQSSEFGEFIRYRIESINFGTAPYRITALNFLSEHEELPEFTHIVYLDNLRAIDAIGNATVVNSFEPDTYEEWQWSSNSRLSQIVFSTAGSNDTRIVSEGTHSLRIQYIMSINPVANTVRPLTLNYDQTVLPPIPVVVTQSFATAEGQASRFRRPLEIGDSLSVDLSFETDTSSDARVEFSYVIVGIVDNTYPTFVNNERLMFVDYDLLRYRLNTDLSEVYDYNVVLFDLAEREPSDTLVDAIRNVDGYLGSDFAWLRYSEIQRDSLTNAVTGMLFVGFWVSLVLSLLDFGFYMTMTIRRRSLSFATLRAIGWNENNLLRLLLIEQIIFIAPAMVIGIVFGILLATIILPFLGLIGSLQLQIPYIAIISLVVVLLVSFTLILGLTALTLRRLSLNKIMRFGE